MLSNTGNENGERGVEHQRVTVIQLLYNHETSAVSIGVENVPIALAQMMVHEAAVQLDIMRRQAATMEMMKQHASAAATQQILEDIKKRR